MSQNIPQLLPVDFVHITTLATALPPLELRLPGAIFILPPLRAEMYPPRAYLRSNGKGIQHIHHFLCDNPTLSPVKHHLFHHCLVQHLPISHHPLHLLQKLSQHVPLPPCLTQVLLKVPPVDTFVRYVKTK